MSNKSNFTKKANRQRNLLHNHPLLHKGGAHCKSNKSRRRLEKVKMKKEWLAQRRFQIASFAQAIHLRLNSYLTTSVQQF